MKEANQSVQGSAQLWTREGFLGPVSVVTRNGYGPDFVSVEGPHAPRRAVLSKLIPNDSNDVSALPTLVASSKLGVRIFVSARQKPMPFSVRNIDADEIHFIQTGQVKFETEVGDLVGEEGDFVCIPRSIAYRFSPLSDTMRSVIVECPSATKLSPPAPFGMVNFGRDVIQAEPSTSQAEGGPTRMILKSADGEHTTFVMATDPITVNARMSSSGPVWKLNLAKIQVLTYLPDGGPPSPFLSSGAGEILLFNLSARITNRPPVHVNADFDEIVCYVRGPGAWGECTEPGTLTWVPKGVTHHGPSENVPEGYSAWLLETRATFRWTPEALAASDLMETGNYGVHPSVRK